MLNVEEKWEFFIPEIVIFVNFVDDDDNNLKRDTQKAQKIFRVRWNGRRDLSSYGNETKNVCCELRTLNSTRHSTFSVRSILQVILNTGSVSTFRKFL